MYDANEAVIAANYMKNEERLSHRENEETESTAKIFIRVTGDLSDFIPLKSL